MPARACPVADADDTRIVCIADDPGTRIEPVTQLAEDLAALVAAFEAARSALPVPRTWRPWCPRFSRRPGAWAGRCAGRT
ncbi:MAG: hypothetical protein AAGF11_35400 [Myxococcota bacterium]